MAKPYSILIFGIFMIIGIYLPAGATTYADHPLTVDFHYKGRSYSISGEKVNEYTYIFNPGAPKQIKITTLEWKPYIGTDICRQGWVQQLTVAMLASQGFEIVSTFYPWARTVAHAEAGNADILYPEYYIEPGAPSDVYEGTRRLDHLAISKKIPGGPIAFIGRKNEDHHYNGNLLNLKGAAIGVVRGYQNTPEFDSLMDRKFFNINEVTDDLTNIKMLVAKRVDLIIGDPAVIYYSVANANLPPDDKNKLFNRAETVRPAIGYNHLYYAVSQKRPHWRETLEMLNRTIDEFDKSGEIERIITKTNEDCGYIMETLPPREDRVMTSHPTPLSE